MKREREGEDQEGPHRSAEEGQHLEPNKQMRTERGLSPHASKVQQQIANVEGQRMDPDPSPQPSQVPKPTVNSAFDYLSQVKQKCPNAVTNELFRVLRDYKSGRLSRRQVVSAVSELLAGHDDLIEGFNAFLPTSEKIDKRNDDSHDEEDGEEQEEEDDGDDEDEPSQGSVPPKAAGEANRASSNGAELANAKSFIEKAKQRFEHQPEVYKTFISLLREFHEKKGFMTIKVLYKKILGLFQGHPDLVAGIQAFLPETVESEGSEHDDAPPPFQRGSKKPKPGRKSGRTAKKEKEKEKERDKGKRAAAPVVAEYSKPSREDRSAAAQFVVSDDLNLFFAIKKKLEDPRQFRDLIKCMNLFNSKVLTRVQLMLLVLDVLGKYPELLQRFKGFIRFTVQEERELMSVLHELYEADLDSSERKKRRRTENIRAELATLIIESRMAINQLGQILSEMAQLTEDVLAELKFDISRLDAACRRTIERLYGEKSKEVLHTIQNNPIMTVPLLLKRLKQKEIEWQDLVVQYGGQPVTVGPATNNKKGGINGNASVIGNGEIRGGEVVNKQESTEGEKQRSLEGGALVKQETPAGVATTSSAGQSDCTKVNAAEVSEQPSMNGGAALVPPPVKMEIQQHNEQEEDEEEHLIFGEPSISNHTTPAVSDGQAQKMEVDSSGSAEEQQEKKSEEKDIDASSSGGENKEEERKDEALHNATEQQDEKSKSSTGGGTSSGSIDSNGQEGDAGEHMQPMVDGPEGEAKKAGVEVVASEHMVY